MVGLTAGLTAGLCHLNAHRTPLVRTFVLVGAVAVPFLAVRVQLPDAGVLAWPMVCWSMMASMVIGYRPTQGWRNYARQQDPSHISPVTSTGLPAANRWEFRVSRRVASPSTVKWLLHIGFGWAELGVGVVQGKLGRYQGPSISRVICLHLI